MNEDKFMLNADYTYIPKPDTPRSLVLDWITEKKWKSKEMGEDLHPVADYVFEIEKHINDYPDDSNN
ncbi:hypothetical protein [Periweissella cryptocerci]|nr:hypothetical protein [Periweissella cryptocerci]